MRLSFILAVFASAASIAYKTFAKGYDGETFGRQVIKTGAYLVFVGILGLIPALQPLVDVFNYMFVVIVLLNDGTDIIKGIGAL